MLAELQLLCWHARQLLAVGPPALCTAALSHWQPIGSSVAAEGVVLATMLMWNFPEELHRGRPTCADQTAKIRAQVQVQQLILRVKKP